MGFLVPGLFGTTSPFFSDNTLYSWMVIFGSILAIKITELARVSEHRAHTRGGKEAMSGDDIAAVR